MLRLDDKEYICTIITIVGSTIILIKHISNELNLLNEKIDKLNKSDKNA